MVTKKGIDTAGGYRALVAHLVLCLSTLPVSAQVPSATAASEPNQQSDLELRPLSLTLRL